MIPTYITQIEKIPVTDNGKLNKRQLPEIKIESKVYVAPKDDTEVMITQIFENILHIESVGTNDNFFEIGGHSLNALGIINEIEHKSGVRIPVTDIFEKPTVIQLAKIIKESNKYTNLRKIPKAEDKLFYSISPMQKHIYILNKIAGKQTTSYNMPGAFEIKGDIDIKSIQNAFQTLVNRHEALRTRFETIDGETVQIIEDDIQISVDYEEKPNIDYDALLQDFVKPFNLKIAPLLRVKIVKFDKQRYILLFDIHHIISDGASIYHIIGEFSKLYQGHTLAEMKLQYKDYSEWIKNYDLSKQRTFWLSQFEDKLPILDLPLDYPRPKQQTFEGKTITVNMPNETKKAIDKLAQATGSTDYTILLTSLMILMNKYTNQEDVVIGSPVSGRKQKDTEEVVGAFFNRLALRGFPEDNKSFNQLLTEITELSLKALDNQDYPIEYLKEEIVEKYNLTRNTLHDVTFAFQNINEQLLNVDGWEIEPKETIDTNIKFDLHMMIEGDEFYKVSLKYASELFSSSTIQRMLDRFINILDSVTKYPEQKISEIE